MSDRPVGDVETLADAIGGCFSNVSDLPEWMQVGALGRSMRPLTTIAARAVLHSEWLAQHDAALLASRDARLAAAEALADEWWGFACEAHPEPRWRQVCRDLRAALRPDPSEASTDA